MGRAVPRALCGARGPGVRRDQGPHQAGRLHSALSKGGVVVLHALRRGPGISGDRAPQGWYQIQRTRAGGRDARRQRARQRARLLPDRRHGSHAQPEAARVCRGHRRSSSIHDPREEPRDRRDLRRRGARRQRRHGLGFRRSHALLRRERSDDAAQLSREETRAGHRCEGRRAGLRGAGRGLLHRRASHDLGAVRRHHAAVHGVRRAARAERRRSERHFRHVRTASREIPLLDRAHRDRGRRRTLDRAH